MDCKGPIFNKYSVTKSYIVGLMGGAPIPL